MIKAILISALSGLLIGAALAYWLYPRNQVQYQDRTKVETRIVTRIKGVKAKDGSSTTETVIVDTGKRSEDVRITAPHKYILGAGATFGLPLGRPDYEVLAAKRVLGPLFVGAKYSTAGSVGIVLLGEF